MCRVPSGLRSPNEYSDLQNSEVIQKRGSGKLRLQRALSPGRITRLAMRCESEQGRQTRSQRGSRPRSQQFQRLFLEPCFNSQLSTFDRSPDLVGTVNSFAKSYPVENSAATLIFPNQRANPDWSIFHAAAQKSR